MMVRVVKMAVDSWGGRFHGVMELVVVGVSRIVVVIVVVVM
jgi:hypothetical protein